MSAVAELEDFRTHIRSWLDTNCPASITVGNDVDKCGSNVFWTAPTAVDNCSNNVSVTQSSTPAGFVPGSLFPVGTTMITYVANDGNGNTISCTFNVTVMDMQTPTAVKARRVAQKFLDIAKLSARRQAEF